MKRRLERQLENLNTRCTELKEGCQQFQKLYESAKEEISAMKAENERLKASIRNIVDWANAENLRVEE